MVYRNLGTQKCFDIVKKIFSLRKTVGKVSPILVTLTSSNDSDFESSNVSLKENKPDGVNPNSNDIDYYVRKSEGKIRWFSADCIRNTHLRFVFLNFPFVCQNISIDHGWPFSAVIDLFTMSSCKATRRLVHNGGYIKTPL